MKIPKVILVTNIISPYRIPLFNCINEVADFSFKVICLAETEENREWRILKNHINFDYQVLPGWHAFITKKEIPIHINRRVIKALRQHDPDMIVTSGYDSLAYWQAFLYCKFFKKKFILWNGTTLLSAGSIKGIRGLLKKIIIKRADRYIVYGTKGKEYLKHFGAKSKDIYISTNMIDNDYFRDRVLQYRANKNFSEERKKYPKILLLYVGQLVKRKGIEQILKALNILENPEIGLMIVGSGSEEMNLKKFCKENKLENIFFKGFHQQEGLPKYYALSDIFIFPTFKEPWGLVINEALACGLYVLCSDRAGSAFDLIKKDWNGALFNPHNVENLAMLIKQTKEQIEIIRVHHDGISEHFCHEFSIERSAKAFSNAVEAVISNKA